MNLLILVSPSFEMVIPYLIISYARVVIRRAFNPIRPQASPLESRIAPGHSVWTLAGTRRDLVPTSSPFWQIFRKRMPYHFKHTLVKLYSFAIQFFSITI